MTERTRRWVAVIAATVVANFGWTTEYEFLTFAGWGILVTAALGFLDDDKDNNLDASENDEDEV